MKPIVELVLIQNAPFHPVNPGRMLKTRVTLTSAKQSLSDSFMEGNKSDNDRPKLLRRSFFQAVVSALE